MEDFSDLKTRLMFGENMVEGKTQEGERAADGDAALEYEGRTGTLLCSRLEQKYSPSIEQESGCKGSSPSPTCC